MAKQETILDVLESGTSEKVLITTDYGKEEVIRNTNRHGKYEYPEGMEIKEELLKRQKKLARREKEVHECGNGGYAAMRRLSDTQTILAELQKDKEESQIYHAIYMQTLQAPSHLRRYVFENLVEWLKDHGKVMKHECNFYVASILPAAWIKGWEDVDLFGWRTDMQLDDLLPAAGFEIGNEVTCTIGRDDVRVGRIIDYKYEQRNIHRRRTFYGNIETTHSGYYILVYDVQYGESRYDHSTFRQNELAFNYAAAV